MSEAPPDPSDSQVDAAVDAAPDAVVDPLIGRTIGGKFVIERLLGAGAMGAVYRARQTALERTVAIKVMHGTLAADPTYAVRFHREAKAVSRIDHPNLIRVLDYGQEDGDGLLYIAMEFLDGRDLFTAIEEEWPLTHARIVDILSQTLSALAEAHAAGVLHRDLKPENIMLLRKKAEDGSPIDTVKVCDFGIAKIAEEAEALSEDSGVSGRRNLTAAGLVVGTPGYMAPEQARSEPCDARSDIYAVGVILYQLLTRRLPFEGNTPLDVVVKALHEPPRPLDTDGPTAAPGLDPVCMKAISKAPDDRYAGAREMRVALRAAPVVERRMVLPAANRPSIVNAATELELTSSASSASAAAPARSASSARRVWRIGAAVAVLAIGWIAYARFGASRPRPDATAAMAAPPSQTTVPVAPLAPGPTATIPSVATPMPTFASAPTTAPLPAPLTTAPPSPARTPGRRSSHETREPKEALATPTEPSPPPPIAAAAPPPDPSPAIPAPTAPPPPPSPIALAPSPPTVNLATARVEIGQARSNNAAATGSAVSRAIAPLAPRFTSCYRAALAQATAASELPATLHVESDDQGYVTSARITGAAPAGAARCIEGLVTHGARIEVDTGTANADVSLTFKPL